MHEDLRIASPLHEAEVGELQSSNEINGTSACHTSEKEEWRIDLKRLKEMMALCAAAERVGRFKGKSLREQEIEISWALINMQYTDKGHYINWCSFELGIELRLRLAEAQNWRCCHCYRLVGIHPIRSWERFATFEHVIHKSRGGADHPDNLAIACEPCNKERGDQLVFKPS